MPGPTAAAVGALPTAVPCAGSTSRLPFFTLVSAARAEEDALWACARGPAVPADACCFKNVEDLLALASVAAAVNPVVDIVKHKSYHVILMSYSK